VPFRQACVTREVGRWYSPLDNEEETNGQYDLKSRQTAFCRVAITAPEPPTHS
jgi:hypothetical protein